MAEEAALSPRSFPQSSSGRFVVSRMLAVNPSDETLVDSTLSRERNNEWQGNEGSDIPRPSGEWRWNRS